MTNVEPEPTFYPQSTKARRLTAAEQQQYARDGYVKNLPVFAPAGVAELQALFSDLAARLPEDVDINLVNMWHKASRQFHDLCRTPAILDYVEDLLGPDFYQWGGQFFVKYPGDGSVVPWHQDAKYWPLTPHKTVTVWLAVFDTDAKNAAMRVVRGSHKQGTFDHHTNDAAHLVLDQEVAASQFDAADIVTLDLKAGQISLHDDGLLHGSEANLSDRVRAGITMRFCPTNVVCDLDVWPTHEAYLARGKDIYDLNPKGAIPMGEQFPVRKFQHSSEFA
jgi:ectoine hydroxylase-related dioxygenase (phytanoyl-CoA dioxygenase family)